jgi:hypothetical protein
MAGLSKPYLAEELVSRLKHARSVPVHEQCHTTAGLSIASILAAVEAGIDNVAKAISSPISTNGQSPTYNNGFWGRVSPDGSAGGPFGSWSRDRYSGPHRVCRPISRWTGLRRSRGRADLRDVSAGTVGVFFRTGGNPAALESLTGDDPVGGTAAVAVIADSPKEYAVKVNGRVYNVEVAPGGKMTSVMAAATGQRAGGETVRSLMARDILRINVTQGTSVRARSRSCHGSYEDGDGDSRPSRWHRLRESGNDWRRRDR